MLSVVLPSAIVQYKQSLNQIIIAPPSGPGGSTNVSVGDDEDLMSDLDAHSGCEGSALPFVMRRLVGWAV